MKDKVIRVILISRSAEIYQILEKYLLQINQITSNKYLLNWLDELEKWQTTLNTTKHDVYLIDENIGESLTQKVINNIQDINKLIPIISLVNSDTNGRFLLKLGILDYLNLTTLKLTDLERSLRLITFNYSKNKVKEPDFQQFFQQTNLGMALIAPSGQFLQVNLALCQLLGYSEQEISELTVQDITHQDDLENSWRYLEKVLTKNNYEPSITKRYLCKNEQWKWIKFSAALNKDSNHNPLYLIATIQNLADDQDILKQIKSSVTLYEGFFSHSTDGFFSLSVLPNNKLIYDTINTAYEQIIGISKDEITGKAIDEVLPDVEARKYHNCINSKESLSYEHTISIKGIAYTWFTILVPIADGQGNIIKIQGSTRDTTQEKQAIAQQIRQTRYRHLLRSIALKIRQSLDIEVILQTTVTELQKTIRAERVILFQFFSDGSGKVIKESVASNFPSMLEQIIIDKHCYETLATKYLGHVSQWSDINDAELSPCHQQMLQQYQVRANLVLPIFRHSPEVNIKDNTDQESNYLWGLLCVQQCSKPRYWNQDEIELLQQLIEQLNIALSQAELLESEIKRREELARSNAELERFAYVVSHDLQAPLQTISNYVQLLERRYREQLDTKADKYIKYIVGGVQRMRTQIQDLLEYSRVGREKSTFRETDCNLVLQQAISNLQSEIELNRATIVTNQNLPTLIADFSQLVVLFQNLISNSLKYRRQIPPHIEIQAQLQGTIWEFSVTDNGIGFEAKYKKRIFQIFQRLHTQEEYPGTGIGLAICQKIVERHGGNIWVESQPGDGSVFYFSLPCPNYSYFAKSNWAIVPDKIK